MIVTFGQTTRGKGKAVALYNTTNTNLEVNMLRTYIAPGSTKFIPFLLLDDLLQGDNFRSSSLYTVNSLGNPYIIDDRAELANYIATGKLVVFTVSPSTSGATSGWTLGVSATPTVTQDGSVYYS